MPTTYTTPIIIADETKAAPKTWGVRLVYEIAHFDSTGKIVRVSRHEPSDTLDGLSTTIKNELRAVHNRVRTVAKARGEPPAGTDTDDF